jgi:predicted Zn-dependent protease
MNVIRVWLLTVCVALSAVGQETDLTGDSDPGVGLKLQTPLPEKAGLSLGVDLPEPRASLDERLDACLALVNEGRRLEALDSITAIMKDYPTNRQAAMAKSVILMKNYKYREAATLLEELIERTPQDAALLNNAAWLYATADQPGVRNGERAVALAKKALLTAPLNYHIWSTVSEGYYISGNFEKALQAAQEAMRLATRSNADFENLREYRAQIMKNMKALQTFSLVD